ncbi:Uncharacterised protein [Mycobacterium tuberculosis]|nr:Uncharacterised protein [Mycobacterium tuberculosis]
MVSKRSFSTRLCLSRSDTPVPIRSPHTASNTVPCASSTSISASTPTNSTLVTRV